MSDKTQGDPMRRGVVLRDEGNVVIVDIDGEAVPCVVRKKLRKRVKRGGKAVVVGDVVHVEQSGEGFAVARVEERRSQVSRRDPSQPRREQVIVANVDRVLVVAAARRPDLSHRLVDRFVVAAESRELDVAIVINKVDLDADGARAEVVDVYRRIGYTVVECSAETGAGIEELRELLHDHTSTMLGHSGVGKSSLANALDPDLSLRIGDVHGSTGRGMHTTTTVSLLRLPWGGYLVDTPGIREFGLWNLDPPDVRFYFREMAPVLRPCRFNDCLHENEPGCAVKPAVESGEIVGWRYESYLKILETLRSDTPDHY
ncbi:MAG: ribosome small subunit-dependent GTPase A [Planctomycetota bacterium]